MSKFAYTLSGGKTALRKMKVSETMATVGVPIIAATADNADGVILGAATVGVDQYGMNVDTATMTRSQASDNSEIEEFVTVVVNADAVWQSRLSGSATSGTALAGYYNKTASATGIAVVLVAAADLSGATIDTSQWDDCPIFCFSGANAGHWRAAQPADATDINFPVATGQAFSKAIAAGDRFFGVPAGFALSQSVTFTTTLDEIDAEFDTTVNTASYYRPVDLILNDEGNNGLLNSYLNIIACDHMFSGSSLA
jgi:hypothetical protein